MLNPVANISGSATSEFFSGAAWARSWRTLSKLACLFSQAMSNWRATTFMKGGRLRGIQNVGLPPAQAGSRRRADYKSAAQQSAILRYGWEGLARKRS